MTLQEYYVNQHAQKNGDHEVHVSTCRYRKEGRHMMYLGRYKDCADAITDARKLYPSADGCYFCCHDCDTDHLRPPKTQ